LEGKDFETFASSSSIHPGVNFVHGFSTSNPVVSQYYGPKRSMLHSLSLMVFQTVVVAPMSCGGFSPWFPSFAPWAHKSPRDPHADEWRSAGDSFSVASCSSPLTHQILAMRPSHLKSNGHDGAIWTSSALYVGIACLQLHGSLGVDSQGLTRRLTNGILVPRSGATCHGTRLTLRG
jgi:hypothetical protein